MIALGMMSGTSLDGVDAALVEIVPRASGYRVALRAFATVPLDATTQAALRAALPPATGSTRGVAELHRRLGDAFVAAGRRVVTAPPDYVASHGQTVWHDGDAGVTLQVGNPFALREAFQASVVFDFRTADCTAGGQGAPLVPYVDALLLAEPGEDRVALNLGGIANVTLLPAGGGVAGAFDVGPANVVLDAFVTERTAARERYDRDGAYARAGRADAAALAAMLEDPYFALAPPKSTGRERFNVDWLARYRAHLQPLGLEDGCATLTELTAASIGAALESAGYAGARVLVSGGGVANQAIMMRLTARLPRARIESSAVFGVDPHAKEAIAFAVLGYETLRGRPAGMPAATGARYGALLGAIAPFRLSALLERIERECAAAS